MSGEPPERGPAWRWLWAGVLGAFAVLLVAEAGPVPDAARSALEFGAALAAIGTSLAWVRANREALARADRRR